jgi:hypothetical protein
VVCIPPLAEWAVQEEQPIKSQDARGTGNQPLGGSPGRDMDHIDRDNDIGLGYRPGLCRSIELQRRQQIRQACRVTPGSNALQSLRVVIGRLPGHRRQGAAEPHGMLTCAAGNLQDQCRLWQAIAQYSQDRATIARRGGGGSGNLAVHPRDNSFGGYELDSG